MSHPEEFHPARRADSITAWMWGLFLVGLPFYIFGDGMPQPAYLLIPVLVLTVGLKQIRDRSQGLSVGHSDILLTLGLFVLYTILVALAWYILEGDLLMLAYPAYYLFNFSLFWLGLAMRWRYGTWFDAVTGKAVVCSVVLQLLLLPTIGTAGLLRQSLYFKNPNQLGYYAMLAATVLFLLRERAQLPLRWLILGTSGAFVLGLISLSRSALMSMMLLILLAFRRRPRHMAVGVVVVAVILGVAWAQLPPYARDRLFMSTMEIDDSFAGRGYDRILNHPGYLLLGAGEGAFDRFQSFLDGEIHSSFGTIVFAYGLPGLLLFSLFMVKLMGRCGGSSWVLLLPALAYGMTHQGLRFTMLWVLFGVSCLQKTNDVSNGR
jgi:hypothetical protein